MDFQTPPWLCEYMVSLLPLSVRTVLEPNPGQGNLVHALAGYEVTAPEEFLLTAGWFDAVVMNPHFTPMVEGYKTLARCMQMTDVIIALMPWLTIINSERRAKQIEEFGLKSVSHVPRSAFPGARAQTCVLEMIRGYFGTTSLRFLERGESSLKFEP